ncbi:MAG TPA: sigma-54 dependent transcriptional regulator [Edaphocola sp.]|nr:sigma-54 dependent transcriptional regulator [Edaphocola sp.]
MLNTILIIDDEEKLRNLLTRIISLEGFEVLQAGDIKSGIKKLEQQDIDVVLCDVKLPDGNGVNATKIIKEKFPTVEIILLTAYGNIPDGVQAIKNGAFDYITKGDDNNKIIPLLNRAIEKVTLAKRVKLLEKQLGEKHSFDKIIGSSKSIQKAIDLSKKVAQTDTTVLLTGETGTGKEVFAQAIHNASKRSKQNFIAVNCSAFSKELLENELFGHKAGAFTGAIKDTKGIFEEANNGTFFLDEMGEMPLDLQAKLLRVLENGEFLKVGDNKPTKVNVRIIAATNRDLKQEVENGLILFLRCYAKYPLTLYKKKSLSLIPKLFAKIRCILPFMFSAFALVCPSLK